MLGKIFTSLLVFAPLVLSASTTVFVAPGGDGDGTLQSPFGTLEEARDAVRDLKAAGGSDSGGYVVCLREGVYTLTDTFELGKADSGTEKQRVIYRPYEDEQVFIRGGVEIPLSAAKPVKEAKGRERIVEEGARDKVKQIDLKALGITDYGQMSARGFRRPYVNPGLELFIDGKALHLARWPNEGFVPIGKVLDKGSTPRSGDYENRGAKFSYDFDRADHWKQADDFYLSGNFFYGYADDTIKVAELDTQAKTFQLAYAHLYGVKSGTEYNNYFVVNLLEEIDQPGEYFVDREAGVIYFYPPEGYGENSELLVSLLDKPMVVMNDASYISLENLTFECSRGLGIYIEGGEHNLIAGCTIRNIGVVAVCMGMGVEPDTKNRHEFTGTPVSRQLGSWHEHLYLNPAFYRNAGYNHGVVSCDIYGIGAGAISLSGGDRLTLKPGNNFVTNCEIHDYNRLDRSYKAAVNIDGVGNLVANNRIYDAPHMAIYLHGNEHIIEYNHIHHVALEASDMGWFYMGRDPSNFGNVLRYNFVHHAGVTDSGIEGDRTMGVSGLYLDDLACGTEIYQNVFYKVGRQRGAMLINGGSDNTCENNIFINCEVVLYASALFKTWMKHNMQCFEKDGLYYQRLHAVDYKNPPYSERYPTLHGILTDNPAQPKRNLIKNNIFVNNKKVFRLAGDPDVTIEDNWETMDDPGFVNPEALDFRLKDNSIVFEKIPGFRPIPHERIGLYPDPYRKEVKPYEHPSGGPEFGTDRKSRDGEVDDPNRYQ